MARLLHHSDIEAVYDDPERAAALAGFLRDQSGPDGLVVGSGDDTAPGVLALVAKGRQALPFFEAAGTRFETFGNHDFDFGPDQTRGLVADGHPVWLSANARDEGGEPFGRDAGVRPWAIERVDGEAVGFFGLTDPTTDTLNPSARTLSFADPIPAAETAIAELHEAGAEWIVALSHLGRGDDRLARRTDVDLVLGGHVHSRRIERVEGAVVARPGVNGRAVLEVELTDDGVSVELLKPAAFDPDPVPAVLEGLREYARGAGLDRVVGRAETPLCRTNETVYGGESRIGNFVTDAYRVAADADVGLQNSGGIRLGPPLSGEVTVADCISVVPFEEQLVTVSLSGAEFRAVAREMAGTTTGFDEDSWWHGHVSGARIVYDCGTDGLETLTVDGRPVADDRRYRVALPEYLLHTDEEFPTIRPRHRVAEHGIQHELLVEHARTGGLSVELDGRIVLQE